MTGADHEAVLEHKQSTAGFSSRMISMRGYSPCSCMPDHYDHDICLWLCLTTQLQPTAFRWTPISQTGCLHIAKGLSILRHEAGACICKALCSPRAPTMQGPGSRWKASTGEEVAGSCSCYHTHVSRSRQQLCKFWRLDGSNASSHTQHNAWPLGRMTCFMAAEGGLQVSEVNLHRDTTF